MTDTADTSLQTAAPSADTSLIVGRIRPPQGMWAALEGIEHTESVRNGVLIIFSQNIKGRIGIFCNRYISGAIVEPSGETGLEAVRELLSARSGMFGFRACMGDESKELRQSLALDISELLLERSSGVSASAGEALGGLMAPGSQLLRTSELNGNNDESGEGTGADASVEEAPAEIRESSTEEDFSYFDWFAEQMGTKDTVPKFRQILMTALPRPVDPTAEMPEIEKVEKVVENDLEMYGRLLQSEQEKVIRDIERSMERGRNPSSNEDPVSELKLLSEFIEAEQARAQKWAGLDEIPTPRGVSGPAVRAGGGGGGSGTSKNTGEFTKEINDLLSTSMHRIPAPKDFVKRIAVEEEAPPPRTKFGIKTEWLHNKTIIGCACIGVLCLLIFGVSSMQNSSDFATCLNEAKNALSNKQPDKAVFVLTKAIEKDPASHRAYFYRGVAHATAGDYDKASADFKAAIMRGAPRDRVIVARASAAMKAGKYDEAVKDADEIIKKDKNNAEARMIRATCNERQKNYEGVIEDTTVALATIKDPATRAHLLLQRGVAQGKTGHQDAAGKDFSEAIELKGDAPTYMQRGDAYRSLKKWAEAVADYSVVLEKDSRDYDAYVARGICYNALHDEREAMKDFGRALSINKNGVEALIQRGSLHLSMANYRLAARDLEDAMKLSSRDSETQQKLAAAYSHLNKQFPKSWLSASGSSVVSARSSSSSSMISDAVDNSTVKKLPSNPRELVTVGYKYLTNGEVDYAIQMFTEAIKKEPNNVDARRYLAHALLESGASESAIAQYGALVTLNAMNNRDALSYAKALANTGNTERAVDVLSHYLQQSPSDAALRAELIRMYNSIGFAQKAEAAYREGLTHASTAAQRALLDSAYTSPRRSAPNGANTVPAGRKVKDSELGG